MTPSKIEREGGQTAGPWMVVEHEVWDPRHDGEPGVPLFRRDINYRRWGRDFKTGEQDANARLIAAAPELLEELETLRDFGCPHCSGDCGSANPPVINCPMQQASAAIAKARGAS